MTLRVLIVDDQDLVRAGFRMILERGGLDVVGEAADGVEAVPLSLALLPDLMLMDIRMPRRGSDTLVLTWVSGATPSHVGHIWDTC